jgi:CDP-diacylglycerol---serine O-phosphatidyltransferase
MASRIPHFSGKQMRRVPRERVIAVLFAVAVLILLIATFPMEMLIALALLYLSMIPFSMRSYRLNKQQAIGSRVSAPAAKSADPEP